MSDHKLFMLGSAGLQFQRAPGAHVKQRAGVGTGYTSPVPFPDVRDRVLEPSDWGGRPLGHVVGDPETI